MLPKSVVSFVLLTLALPVSAEAQAASHHDDDKQVAVTDGPARPVPTTSQRHATRRTHAKPEAARPKVTVRAHATGASTTSTTAVSKKIDKREKVVLVTKPKPAVPNRGANAVSGYEPVVMMSKPLPMLPRPIVAAKPVHRDPKLDTNHEPKLDPNRHHPKAHDASKPVPETKAVEAAKEPKHPEKAKKPEAAKPEAAKPEAAKPEAAKPEAAKPEAAKKIEAAKPEAKKVDAPKVDAKDDAAEPEAVADTSAEPAPIAHAVSKVAKADKVIKTANADKAERHHEPKLDGKPEQAKARDAKEPELTKATSRTPLPVSAKIAKPTLPTCVHEPVEISRGTEGEKFSLTRCDGTVAPMAVERLSILARPGSAARPSDPSAFTKGAEVSPGVLRVDAKLVERLQSVVDHFSRSSSPSKITVVSGYRPSASGSYHASGRALDFRMDGVNNEALVAFCKTIPDTGCGFYPNSSFVHIDVRDPATGHVSWIDASTTGESPRYVVKWPPPEPEAKPEAKKKVAEEALAKIDKDAPAEVTDDHPAQVVDKEDPNEADKPGE